MDEPKSLDSLFKQKIFRIPDYQRGYAWQREQLRDFWEDLINLSDNRSHYTGVLTLKQIPSRDIAESDKEFWLVDDHSYEVYHIVDGQQRLTTFIVLLQAYVDFIRELPTFKDKPDTSIYLTDSLNVAELQSRYLFKIKPTGDRFRTYKFGYTKDNPSYDYLRFRVLGEDGGGAVQETFYTLNLSNAKKYFAEQLRELHRQENLEGLQHIYKKLTKRFLFNEYIIKDEFDVFIAFETMNNRGKKLSDLELLKNRLIYLTTLYNDEELDAASRKSLRDTINDAWKEVYHQLGRNKARPLNDDEFLRAHWTMFFKYSRKTGQDYIRFLLDEQFTPKKVHKRIEEEVVLEIPQEQPSESIFDETLDENGGGPEATPVPSSAQLQPTDIRDFVISLKESAVHWFRSFYPELDENLSDEERSWIDRLNRIGLAYFRPLVMAILKNVSSSDERVQIFKRIERFIFIVFRANAVRATYGSSEFYNAARELDQGALDLQAISSKLESNLNYTLNEDQSIRIDDFYNLLFKKFKGGSGYYSWSGLRYFLYEYELSLLSESRQKKVDWSDLLKTEGDKISIEHIYPQTETKEWATHFVAVEQAHRGHYNATLGNLLLLSMAINSALQNDSFEEKRQAKFDLRGNKIRNGYSDGSHSEIEVSNSASWGPEQIKSRGIHLLRFMEKRWDFRFKNDEEREKLLFLEFTKEAE
jgi:uncharacterized protein with ParB-like and HNH nuclease domain